MDKEEQLSFDFGDTQPVFQDERIKELPEETENKTIQEQPIFNEEPQETIPIQNTLQNFDPSNFGDTQPVSFDIDKTPIEEDFSPPDIELKEKELAPSLIKAQEHPPLSPYAAVELEKEVKLSSPDRKTIFRPQNMRRAVLGWILTKKPSGVGVSVPTRVSKFCADIAAFWSSPGKKRLMQPDKTLIVEIRRTREQCWPDCSRQEELLPLLIEEKELKISLQAEIRKTEPELKDSDTLFPEYESWRYAESKNRNYRRCLRQIEKIEHALYQGSRFEQIRRAHVADFLYLAVPEGTVNPNELADGWGLINIKSDLSANVVREAETWNCPVPNRIHLAQNIAAASRDSVFFAFGIRLAKDGKPKFSPIPKRRRSRLKIN